MTLYFDFAAATPLDPKVLAKMLPYLKENYANPSSLYVPGREARAAIDEARQTVAQILHCKSSEIFFTSGGTEANNWAVFGTANASAQKKHLISTKIEHHSVLHPVQELERRGYEITWLPLDEYGLINLRDLKEAIKPETVLISVMHANNEIGTIENIAEIANAAHSKGVILHTDACQAPGALPLNTLELDVDLLTLNAGKMHGPKGIGALFIRENTKITPLLYGGGQEHRLRAGTENVAAIVGFAEAFRIAEEKRETESVKIAGLRDGLISELYKMIPNIKLNGHPKQRLPNNINITIPGIDAEILLMKLDLEGICISSGSACTSGSLDPSHVLLGIGLPKQAAKSSIRITIGAQTTAEELVKLIKQLTKFAKKP